MSLNRLIYYGAILGGWSAFVGWLLAELLFAGGERSRDFIPAVLLAAFVGAAIAGALSILPALANAQWQQALKRLGPGLLGGFIAGLVGGLIGDGLYRLLSLAAGANSAAAIILGRIPGWILMGLAIGAVEGVYDRSPRKLRNGLIGGALGGLLGGLLFDPLVVMMHSGTGMASRATAFVILGMCIGLLIGVVQVVFKQAWLTVADGFRPGRQLILTEPETFMGTSEKVALPFIAFGAKGVEPRHVRILRQPDGSYVALDNNSRSGTRVNGHPLTGPVLLRDGDVISFGVNMVRFSERRKALGVEPVLAPVRPAAMPAGVQPVVVTPVAIKPAPGQPRPAVPVAPVVTPIRQGPPPGPAQVVPPAAVPVRPLAPPQAPPAPARPPAQAQPPTAAPPAAQPQRIVPVASQPQPPAAPKAPARPAASSDLCPNCGIRAAGAPGSRVCMICGLTF
jgi:hypothetical protein